MTKFQRTMRALRKGFEQTFSDNSGEWIDVHPKVYAQLLNLADDASATLSTKRTKVQRKALKELSKIDPYELKDYE